MSIDAGVGSGSLGSLRGPFCAILPPSPAQESDFSRAWRQLFAGVLKPRRRAVAAGRPGQAPCRLELYENAAKPKGMARLK